MWYHYFCRGQHLPGTTYWQSHQTSHMTRWKRHSYVHFHLTGFRRMMSLESERGSTERQWIIFWQICGACQHKQKFVVGLPIEASGSSGITDNDGND